MDKYKIAYLSIIFLLCTLVTVLYFIGYINWLGVLVLILAITIMVFFSRPSYNFPKEQKK